MITTGTFNQNAADQPNDSTRCPPMSGPMAAPAPATEAQMPMARVRSLSSVKILRINDSVEGITMAPPTPSRARPTISCAGACAVAATMDASPNSTNPARNKRFRP